MINIENKTTDPCTRRLLLGDTRANEADGDDGDPTGSKTVLLVPVEPLGGGCCAAFEHAVRDTEEGKDDGEVS